MQLKEKLQSEKGIVDSFYFGRYLKAKQAK
jgi:hypothetical protein